MIKEYKTKQEFLKEHLSLLEEDEIKNNLFIGIASRDRDEEYYLVSSIINDKKLVGMIAGKNMILASNTLDFQVVKDLVVHMQNVDYPGIIGPKDLCELYNQLFKELNDTEMSLTMDQRIYSCTKINHYSEDIGVARLGSFDEFETLLDWVYEFELMIEEEADREQLRGMLTKRLEAESIYVLEIDGEIVSMAARSRPLKQSETVSLVFTPQELRRRGYASRVTELLTEVILNDGKIATLYTDLANPTSNSIYMKIGYNPHCDSVMMNKK